MTTRSIPDKPAASDLRALQRLDHQLCFALYSSSLLMTKLYKPVLGSLGLTYPQYIVLLVLWETDQIAVGELGTRLYLDSGTLTPLLKRLEANGLVGRNRDRGDERQVRISLSDAGRALRERATQIPQQVLCASGQEAGALGRLRAELSAVRDGLCRPGDDSL
jgi:DNA-binding MarR family transcriptional regulator